MRRGRSYDPRRRLVDGPLDVLRHLLVSISVAAPALDAQCTRPPVPLATAGFGVETITYGDGVTTRGELIAPVGPAPTCGWPLVVYVHSLGSTRAQQHDWQQQLASHGFAVWAYDVRGQGDARMLGPAGTTMYGPHERCDLAEQIAFVRATRPTVVSADKVAVTGDSQGGIHGWFAATESGRTLNVPGRGAVAFPTITAVAAADFVTEPTRHRVRGGTLFSTNFLDLVLAEDGVVPLRINATFRDAVTARFLAQDPEGLAAWLLADPHRAVETHVPAVGVPTLFFHAWHDSICGAGPILDATRAWPASTPLRLVLGALGHATPNNAWQLAQRRELTLRWFERWLWDIADPVGGEERFVLADVPSGASEHADEGALWPIVHLDAFPPSDVVIERCHTWPDGRLDPSEPSAPGSSAIEHRVAPGFDAAAYAAAPASRGLDNVLQNIPLGEQRFVRAALDRDVQLAGAPRVGLSVVPDAARFTIAAMLSVRVPGAAQPRMLSMWGVGVRDATPGVARRLEFELSPIVSTLPAGSVLELSLRNHWLPEEPHLRWIATVPMFESSRVLVEHGSGAAASWLELPLRTPPVAIVSPATTIARDVPGRTELGVRGGAESAGRPYVIAASCTGHRPGIVLPGGELPIRFDATTETFAMLIGSRELIAFAGTLDAHGNAQAALDLSGLSRIPDGLSRLSFATWVFRSPTDITGRASNPLDLSIR